MASPFAVFRRNQKIMLAVVGIGAMVAFVFLGPVMQYLSGAPKRENPVIVETNFGNFTAGELENLRFSREIVDRFLQRVTAQVISKMVERGNLDAREFNSLADRQYQLWHGQLMGRWNRAPEQATIETLVLAQQAEQLGMVISDQVINDWLKQITAETITPAELQEIIRGLQPSRPISEARFFNAVRTEMLASEYSRLFAQSLRDIPPAQRFAYYSRLNRQATAEVMPLAVADFVDQVDDPSDEEIKAFYEKYKNDFPNPNSPEPGFKEPKRASFQYFKADITQLTEALKPDITDQEIQEYYDDNKSQFRLMNFDDEPAASETPDTEAKDEASPDADDKTDSDKPAEPAGEPEKDDAKTPVPAGDSPAEPAEKPEPADKTEPEPDAEGDSEPSAEKPAEEKAAEPDEAADDTAPESAQPTQPAPVRLVSTTLAAEPSDEGQDVADDGGTSDAQPPEEPSSPKESAPPQDDPKADEAQDSPAADKASVDDKPASNPPAQEPSDEKPAGETPSEEAPADTTPADETGADEPRFEPLEKVADTIRTTLARQQAADRLTTQFDELSGDMRRYTDELDIYNADKGAVPGLRPPAALNFAELAKGKDVQPLELKSVTADQVAEEDLGRSFRVVQDPRTGMPQTVPFVSFAFSDRLPTHKSEIDQDNDNHAFLFWKTEEEPAYVPPLDQIRDKVVRAWKMIKARKLARQRAEEFASQARALKQPLQEAFGEQAKLKATDTGSFTWLTFGNVPAQPGAPPRLSVVEGVDRPGEEFMETVFGLEPSEAGVAMNEPQDIVYVIRLVKFEPPMEELRDDFARANPSRYIVAASTDQRATYQAWIEDLTKQAGVHWVRQADARATEDEDTEF